LQLYIDYYQALLDKQMDDLHDTVDALQIKRVPCSVPSMTTCSTVYAYYRSLIPDIREESSLMLDRIKPSCRCWKSACMPSRRSPGSEDASSVATM
jgi:hypothetical protein